MEWLRNEDTECLSNNRRLVRVAITGGLIKDIITTGKGIRGPLKVVKGIPEDAVFICSMFHDANQIAYLIFYCQSFDSVPVGNEIPTIDIIHKIGPIQ